MKKSLWGVLAVAVLIAGVMIGSSFAAGNYWDKWQKTIRLDIFPECGVNVRGRWR